MWDGVTEELPTVDSMMLRSAWYGYNMRVLANCSSHNRAIGLFEGACGSLPFVIKIVCPGHEAHLDENLKDERAMIDRFGTGHPNVMSLLEIPGFDHKYFVMPRNGLALDKLITTESYATVTNAERSGIFKNICAAMLFIVSHGIVHGDINLRNILTRPGAGSVFGNVVLTDFGFSSEAKKLVIGAVLRMEYYSQSNAVWLQAVNSTSMYAIDAIHFFKYIVCPVLGLYVRQQLRNDVLVSISGVTMEPLAVSCPATTKIFRQSVSDMMLLSEIDTHVHSTKVINPLRVVTNIPVFVRNTIGARIRTLSHGGETFLNSKYVLYCVSCIMCRKVPYVLL